MKRDLFDAGALPPFEQNGSVITIIPFAPQFRLGPLAHKSPKPNTPHYSPIGAVGRCEGRALPDSSDWAAKRRSEARDLGPRPF